MRRSIAAIIAALWALSSPSAWAGSSSVADTKTTFAISFDFNASDGTGVVQGNRGTDLYADACRSGVAYLQDGSTGTVNLHGVPNANSAVAAGTNIGTISAAGLSGAVTWSDMPARYVKIEITVAATTESQVRIQCTNAG